MNKTKHITQEGWIPVTARLPEVGTDCLVWTKTAWAKEPYALVDRWDEQHECPVSWSTATIPIGPGWDGSEFDDVTHWMPLPPPPTQEGGGMNENADGVTPTPEPSAAYVTTCGTPDHCRFIQRCARVPHAQAQRCDTVPPGVNPCDGGQG